MQHATILRSASVALVLCLAAPGQDTATQKRAMTLQDVMRFEQLTAPAISENGDVVVYATRPDRGDGAVHVHHLATAAHHTVPQATRPVIAGNGTWVLATVVAPFDHAGKRSAKDTPKNGLALVHVPTGKIETIERVMSAAFSEDGHFVAWRHHAAEAKDDAKKSKRTTGTALVLRPLGGGDDVTIEDVTRFAFSPDGSRLTYVVCTADGQHNGLFSRHLRSGRTHAEVFAGGIVTRFAWNETATHLAFAVSAQDDDGEHGDAAIHVTDGKGNAVCAAITSATFGDDWALHRDTGLTWSKDGRQLRFGVRDQAMENLLAALATRKKAGSKKNEAPAEAAANGEATPAEAATIPEDAYDLDRIREDREVDVWHYRDPLISTHRKKAWSGISRHSHACVLDLDAAKPVRLADAAMPAVTFVEGSPRALGTSDAPYRREVTWDGRYRDVYLVDVATGTRTKVLTRHSGRPSLSPKGRYLVWYDDGHWHLRDNDTGKTRALTEGLGVPFADEDHDYPSDVPGYGVAGWYGDESAVLIYDKYDIWRIEPATATRRCTTAGIGRKTRRQLRIVDLEPKKAFIDPEDGPLLLTGFDTKHKGWGFWRLGHDDTEPRVMIDTDDRLRVVAKAETAHRLLFTREDYDRFPDLHVANLDLTDARKVTDLDTQRDPFHWGTAELISWKNEDGRDLQGAVIKPGNYEPGKRYPVLVYYYRFFAQRVNEWNQVVVNHRPCFPWWASNGYVVFLPDIRFDVGHPGHAATKCLIPGIEKLVESGIADPKAIALHGHSWSGYQTAHVITETNVFACAIAGAPVSNMTSAYGGIRWGSGLSRQFQYEKTQSRIGANLWEARDRYIDNSPVFFADKIETPLLIQFGDEDGAVPWTQGIELYMAMRRLDKPCVFLQYRGEPHHLQKYANKLDYTIRFKEYVDHYCRGTEAPAWITTGEPYAGK